MSRWERFKDAMVGHPLVTGLAITSPVVAILSAPLIMDSKSSTTPAPDPVDMAQYMHHVPVVATTQAAGPLKLDRFGALMDQGYIALDSKAPLNNDWSRVSFTGKDGIQSFDDVTPGMWKRVDEAAAMAFADSVVIHYAANHDLLTETQINRFDFAADALKHGVVNSLERAAAVASGTLDRSSYGRMEREEYSAPQIADVHVSIVNSHVMETPSNAVPAAMSMKTLLEGVHDNMTPDMEIVTKTLRMEIDGEMRNFSAIHKADQVLQVEVLPEAHDVKLVQDGYAADMISHDTILNEPVTELRHHREFVEARLAQMTQDTGLSFINPLVSAAAPIKEHKIELRPLERHPVEGIVTGQKQRIESLRNQMLEAPMSGQQRIMIDAPMERQVLSISQSERQEINLTSPKRTPISLGTPKREALYLDQYLDNKGVSSDKYDGPSL